MDPNNFWNLNYFLDLRKYLEKLFILFCCYVIMLVELESQGPLLSPVSDPDG